MPFFGLHKSCSAILEFGPKLYIRFRSGQNGRKISYRYANRYEITPYSTSDKILGCFRSFWPFRWISGYFGRYVHFGRFTFLGFFFFSLLSFSTPSSSSFFFLLLLSFFRPALSLSLYLWWTTQRTAVTKVIKIGILPWIVGRVSQIES